MPPKSSCRCSDVASQLHPPTPASPQLPTMKKMLPALPPKSGSCGALRNMPIAKPLLTFSEALLGPMPSASGRCAPAWSSRLPSNPLLPRSASSSSSACLPAAVPAVIGPPAPYCLRSSTFSGHLLPIRDAQPDHRRRRVFLKVRNSSSPCPSER